jgi:hypothetical protein
VLARQSDDELRRPPHVIDDPHLRAVSDQLSKDENDCSCLKGNLIRL